LTCLRCAPPALPGASPPAFQQARASAFDPKIRPDGLNYGELAVSS
jgi:hypothetical protein